MPGESTSRIAVAARGRAPAGKDALKRLFEEQITTREIASPLVSFDETADSELVLDIMGKHGFDVVGVRRNGLVVGWASKTFVRKGPLNAACVELKPDDMTADNSPLLDCLRGLRDRPWMFVHVLGNVAGIVTRSDLHRPPVKLWLFGLVNLCEMYLTEAIRGTTKESAWRPWIDPERLSDAEDVLRRRRKADEEIELLDCLHLMDKSRIMLQSKELRQACGLAGWEDAGDFFKQMRELRDNLAHAQDLPVGRWDVMVELAEKMERMIDGFDDFLART